MTRPKKRQTFSVMDGAHTLEREDATGSAA